MENISKYRRTYELKNVLLKISIALTLLFSIVTPAISKPAQAATISYLMNPTSTFEYTDANGNYNYAFSDKFNEYDWWKSPRGYLFVKETNEGLYETNIPSHVPVQAIAYPIVQGKKWEIFENNKIVDGKLVPIYYSRQIESTNSTVITPAGTFTNVVVVRQDRDVENDLSEQTPPVHVVTYHYYAPYAGEILRKDAAGKIVFQLTKGTNLKVLDLTPPAVPTIGTVADYSGSIGGTAESKSKVYAWAGSKKLGEATASNGKYSIRISRQKAGTVISVYSVDAAGNKSGTRTTKVIDRTAPTVPSITSVTDKSVIITGKAESKSKVYAWVGSKKLGSATANNGKYSIKISKQKAGTAISVYSLDLAGNKSSKRIVKVLDRTAPKTPTVNKVTSKTVYIKGKAEKKATVYVYNKSKKIGTAKVDSKGNFKVKIKKQKKKSKLTVYVKDSAGNKSKVKSVIVY